MPSSPISLPRTRVSPQQNDPAARAWHRLGGDKVAPVLLYAAKRERR